MSGKSDRKCAFSIDNRSSIDQTTMVTEDKDLHFEDLKISLDHACSEIAARFNFYLPNGEPRTAPIIDILASSPCIGCILRRLQQRHRPQIDAMYLENHRLAVGILVEQLHSFLNKMGYKALVLPEARSEHSTVDVLIVHTNYGVNIQHGEKNIVIEVKTGNSLSYSQLFRSLFDVPNATMVLWRITRHQVVVIRRKSLQPMLLAFMRMCILRGKRVLSETEQVECRHFTTPINFSLSSKEFERALCNFTEALVDTLPVVLETVLQEMLPDNETQDRAGEEEVKR